MSRIAFIDNTGPNSAQTSLKKLFDGALSADVQVAFTTKSGLAALLARLRKVATKGKVRFLTGLYQANTEPAALRMLLRAEEQSGGRFEARLSTETRFHRKAYVATTRSTLHIIVGSSNLTANGLTSGGELNVLLSWPRDSAHAKSAKAIFDQAWNDGVALTADRIDRYDDVRVRPIAPQLSQTTLAAIIGKNAKHRTSDDEAMKEKAKNPRFWVDGVTGHAGQATAAVIADETDWDRNGWEWCSTHTTVFRREDRLLVLDRSTKPSVTRHA